MPEPTRINLTYHGREVDDGTMPIGLVADALDGFSSAYRKIASYLGPPDAMPELRLAAPKQGSYDLLVLAGGAIAHIAQNPNLIAQGWEYARKFGHVLAKIIELKKLLKGQPYTIHIEGDGNNVNIIQGDVRFETTREILEIYEAKLTDRDVSKIIRPLHPDRIDSAELKLDDKTEVEVRSDERQYFEAGPSETTTTKAEELIGSLVSTNKEQKRGTFRMENGRTVPYHYVGDSDEEFLREFSYKGAVRVTGEIKSDESGKPIHLSIESVTRLQKGLFGE